MVRRAPVRPKLPPTRQKQSARCEQCRPPHWLFLFLPAPPTTIVVVACFPKDTTFVSKTGFCILPQGEDRKVLFSPLIDSDSNSD